MVRWTTNNERIWPQEKNHASSRRLCTRTLQGPVRLLHCFFYPSFSKEVGTTTAGCILSLSPLVLKLEGSPGRGNGERLPETPREPEGRIPRGRPGILGETGRETRSLFLVPYNGIGDQQRWCRAR
jgi:hypothetical protein